MCTYRYKENGSVNVHVHFFVLGRVAVIRSDLTNPWIPNGKWGWGGTASSHCPVMTEFRLDNESSIESKNLHDDSTDVESTCATFLIGSDS